MFRSNNGFPSVRPWIKRFLLGMFECDGSFLELQSQRTWRCVPRPPRARAAQILRSLLLWCSFPRRLATDPRSDQDTKKEKVHDPCQREPGPLGPECKSGSFGDGMSGISRDVGGDLACLIDGRI
jgi:hypothetical protein